jgi:hypothetical protein
MVRDTDALAVRLNPFLAGYCLVGAGVSLLVNLLTYVGIATQEYVPLVWGLHLAIFPSFIVFAFRLREWHTGSWWHRRLLWREMLRFLPRTVAIGIPLLFAATLANFFTATSHLPNRGVPYQGTDHETALYTIRAFSGHWVLFFALPAVFFLFVPAGPRRSGSTSSRAKAGIG